MFKKIDNIPKRTLKFRLKPSFKPNSILIYNLCEYTSNKGTILVCNEEIFGISYDTTFNFLFELFEKQLMCKYETEYENKKKHFLNKMGVNFYAQKLLLYTRLVYYKLFKGECLHKKNFEMNDCPIHETQSCLCINDYTDGLLQLPSNEFYYNYYMDLKNGRIFEQCDSMMNLRYNDVLGYIYDQLKR